MPRKPPQHQLSLLPDPAPTPAATPAQPIIIDLADFWPDPITSYTRAQAIADGVLHDVSPIAQGCGFYLPTAATNTIVTRLTSLCPPVDDPDPLLAQLSDVLQASVIAGFLHVVYEAIQYAAGADSDTDRAYFPALLPAGAGRWEQHQCIAAIAGPERPGQPPCLTVMLPEDD